MSLMQLIVAEVIITLGKKALEKIEKELTADEDEED